MADSENQQKPDVKEKIIASRVSGTVKWFNVKKGFGYLTRDDTQKDVFVHQMALMNTNPNEYMLGIGEDDKVEFDVIKGAKGMEAANVTVLGKPVQGSPGPPRRGGGQRRNFRRRAERSGDAEADGESSSADEQPEQGNA